MKTRFLLMVILMQCVLPASRLFSQHYVPVQPLNKNVIYEEFTGVKCPNCPSGHQVMAQILASNPGRAFVVAYHPFNSSYTLPYAGDPDFRRHYADSLYMTPWCGTSRYMPSAFVARRLWTPGERLTERTNWETYGNTVMNESSPLNVGMATHYDQVTGVLSLTVDVYYTASVSGGHNIMVTLAENDLQSQQSGGTSPYTHKHTFRESFVGQWGDPLSQDAQAGTFFRKVFTFDNTTTAYNMTNCELLAFVIDNASDEVISGIGCHVGDTTFVTPDITLSADTLFFTTLAQCEQGLSAIVRNNTPVPVDLEDVQPASLVPGSTINWVVDPWPFTTFPYTIQPGDSVVITVKVDIPLDATANQFFFDSLHIESEVDNHFLKIAVDQSLYTSITESDLNRRVGEVTVSPNPCRDQAGISLFLPESSEVILEILNSPGQVVARLFKGQLDPGVHAFSWDCLNIKPGLFYLRLITEKGTAVQRLVVVK